MDIKYLVDFLDRRNNEELDKVNALELKVRYNNHANQSDLEEVNICLGKIQMIDETFKVIAMLVKEAKAKKYN